MPIIYSLQMKDKYKGYKGCVCQNCKVSNHDEHCELKLGEFQLKNRVIIDVDCISRSKISGRRCDHVIMADGTKEIFFLPIEFKRRSLNFCKIKEQFENSIQHFIKEEDLPKQFLCYPVLVSRGIKSQERKILSSIEVKYKNGNKTIKHVSCNEELPWKSWMKIAKAASSRKKASKP